MQNETVAATINGNEANVNTNRIIEVKNAEIKSINLHGEGSRGRIYITTDKQLDVTSENGIIKGHTFHISLFSLYQAMIANDDLIFAANILKASTPEDWTRKKHDLKETIIHLMVKNIININYILVPAGAEYTDFNTGEIKISQYSYDSVFYNITIDKVFKKNIEYADNM